MIRKTDKRIRLKKKIRTKIFGKPECPRFSVFRSNKFIYAQIIDDVNKKTLTQASDLKIKKGSKTERAQEVGKIISQNCLNLKIKKVIFDRNGFKYTGRIKTVAEAARSGGLNF